MTSNAIKDLSVSSSSPIGFEVEWHNSQFDKWYQSQGHGFKLRECHCEGGIVGETIIWLFTTTLKTGMCGVMLNAIKDLSVFFSSPIGFEVKWHSLRSNSIFWKYVWVHIDLLLWKIASTKCGPNLIFCYNGNRWELPDTFKNHSRNCDFN